MLGVVAVAVVLLAAWPEARSLAREVWTFVRSGDREGFARWIRSLGAGGVLLVLATMLVQAVLAFLPSVLVMVAAVLAYGPWWGGLLSWVGLVLAAQLAYAIGRGLGPVTVRRLVGGKTLRAMEDAVERYGPWAVVVARVSPILSTDAVSYAAGLLRLGWVPFTLATAGGSLPLVALIGWLGGGIDTLRNGLIVITVVSVAALGAYVWWDRRRLTGSARASRASDGDDGRRSG